jgi:hypothetical protein
MESKIGVRLRVKDIGTCPICIKPMKFKEMCVPLYNSSTVVGYAHAKCFNAVDRAMTRFLKHQGDD